MGLHIATLSETFPIFWLNGATWTSREISGEDCLQMAINANANNNAFMLIPNNISNVNAYTIISYKMTGTEFYLLDSDSGLSPSGYTAIIGYRNPTDGFSRPDLRGIRLASGTTLTPNYSGNVNATNITFAGNNYQYFGSYADYGLDPVIYIPSSVESIYINDNPLVTYTWSSVPAISGKNGILSLPMLDTLSWDGTPITNAERDIFTTLPDMANIKSLYDNIVFGQTVPIVYAGDEHVALITWNNATSFTIDYKYNIADALALASITYTLAHAQDDVYFAFVSMISGDPEDPEQQVRWARPSFVFRDAVTGKYSFGTESFGDDSYYPAFYNWHIAGFSADFSIFGDPNGEEGGDGYGDLVDDPIGNPVTPSIGAVATGFTRLYYITGANKDKLTSLMNWFNDDDIQFVNQLFKGDPMQALVGVNLSPLPLTATGHPNIYFLGMDTGVASDGVIADQFQEIDCGSIDIDLWMKNTYLDFAPYTSIKAVLPYVGCIDLNTDDLKYRTDAKGKQKKKGCTLSLKYVIDTLTGACVAHLFVDGSLHYEASGNCYISIPLTQKDYTSEVNAIRQAVAGVADSLVKGAGLAAMGVGGMGAVAAGVAGTAVGAGINVAVQHPNIKYVGGNTGAVTGYMGFDRPYLLVEQPILARPAFDEHYFGMPSYITDTIGSFRNSNNNEPQFAKFNEVHLENINCTEQERNEILEFLHNGVMLDDGSSAPNVTPAVTGNKVIVLLHNKSEKNVIGKTFTSGTGSRLKIEGNTFFNQSILSPVFIIPATEVYTYNYAYVPTLHRYYYITDIVALENNMLEVHMQVDPLQSFKTEIMACKAICSRSEWRNNYLINDGAMMVKQPQIVKTIQFVKGNQKFSFLRGEAGFVIVVASGATL